MDRTVEFEFHSYPCDEHGAQKGHNPEITYTRLRDMAAARGYAGRLAKKANGPVDLAYAEPANENWEDRYLTTASPSEYHKTGYRFERLV